MLIKDLVEFGLSEKEAKAYLALLELEKAGVQEISNSAGLNRSSTYVTLESLKKKGLVSISDDKNVREYVPTPPEAVLRIAEKISIEKENVLKKIENILPEMKALYKGTKKKPVVKVYEGREGLINAFEETLQCREKLLRIYSRPHDLGQIIYDYIPTYVAKRFKLGIKMLGIHPNDKTNRELMKKIPKGLDEVTLVKVDKNKPHADLAIFDNKIAYMSKENGGIAISIESQEMANVMKTIFDLAFKSAKRENILK